jgi:hypothetical protein
MLGVLLGRMLMVISRMQRMTVRHFGMMCGLLVIAGFGVLGGLAMMRRRMVVMICRDLVMLMDFVTVHCRLPIFSLR